MMNHRKIIHIDMDAFYASVEQRDHPHLQGKPVAVGGGGKRGVVAAASYEARAFGVRSAMPGYKAKNLCPHIIFVRSRFHVYKEVSQQIRNIFFEYSDLVEPLSLDEAYIDVTENKKGIPSATIIAQEIRKKIFEQTQLTASAGISINKFLAKIASDINKPNGIKVIHPHEALAFLEQLPIEKFHGIGKATAKKMHAHLIKTGKDLKAKTKIELAQLFGKTGIWYYHIVRAEDHRTVKPNRIRKSISAERTFSHDLSQMNEMIDAIENIANVLFDRMEKVQKFGRTLSLKIRFNDFNSITRSISFSQDINDRNTLIHESEKLVKEHLSTDVKIRLLGLTISNLSGLYDTGEQLKIPFPPQEG